MEEPADADEEMSEEPEVVKEESWGDESEQIAANIQSQSEEEQPEVNNVDNEDVESVIEEAD